MKNTNFPDNPIAYAQYIWDNIEIDDIIIDKWHNYWKVTFINNYYGHRAGISLTLISDNLKNSIGVYGKLYRYDIILGYYIGYYSNGHFKPLHCYPIEKWDNNTIYQCRKALYEIYNNLYDGNDFHLSNGFHWLEEEKRDLNNLGKLINNNKKVDSSNKEDNITSFDKEDNTASINKEDIFTLFPYLNKCLNNFSADNWKNKKNEKENDLKDKKEDKKETENAVKEKIEEKKIPEKQSSKFSEKQPSNISETPLLNFIDRPFHIGDIVITKKGTYGFISEVKGLDVKIKENREITYSYLYTPVSFLPTLKKVSCKPKLKLDPTLDDYIQIGDWDLTNESARKVLSRFEEFKDISLIYKNEKNISLVYKNEVGTTIPTVDFSPTTASISKVEPNNNALSDETTAKLKELVDFIIKNFSK